MHGWRVCKSASVGAARGLLCIVEVNDVFSPNVSFLGWIALAGSLMLVMALCSAHLRRLPVSASLLYLAMGFALGPAGLGWLRLDFVHHAQWLEHVTEIAVVISLFVGGLKLRQPLSSRAWRSVPRLAVPLMLVSIVGIAAFAHVVLALSLASALLLGAVLAPTDPVLAAAVSVNQAADKDRMRYGLSGEAGLNDGMAFPFVVFALLYKAHRGAGDWVWGWALWRLLWAVPAALALGYAVGRYVSALAMRLKSEHRHAEATSDFLALSLISLSYVLAEAAGAWGFLAAFAAGLGLRSAEIAVVRHSPHPDHVARTRRAPRERHAHPPTEDLVLAHEREEGLEQPAVAAGVIISDSLTFGRSAERILELLLVSAVGVAVATHWDIRAVPVALVAFVLLRPPAARLLLVGTPTSIAQRWLMGWFGVRGVGSLYYLAYALNEGGGESAREIVGITLSVITLSIVVHGVTAQPLLCRYQRALEANAGGSA